jgi:hypothetical protein
MITLEDYFGPWMGHPDVTADRMANAKALLMACDRLQAMAEADGVKFPQNTITGSGVSGEKYGGFRPQDCPEGAPGSSHKQGLAVDRYDPHNTIDDWCMAYFERLARCGIYIEHPSATPGWSHWTIRAPRSGTRAFLP